MHRVTREELFTQNRRLVGAKLKRPAATRLLGMDRTLSRDDLAQEANAALWKATGAYDPSRGPFVKLAGAYIHNRFVEMRVERSAKKRNGFGLRGCSRQTPAPVVSIGESDEDGVVVDPIDRRAPDPASGLERADAARFTTRVLAMLPERIATMLRRRFLEGWSWDDIAHASRRRYRSGLAARQVCYQAIYALRKRKSFPRLHERYLENVA